MKLEPLLRRHPLRAYFALAYVISWGGILILLCARGFDLTPLPLPDTAFMFVLMLLGPSTSGLALTALLDGRAGLHRLASSLIRWRVAKRWYAVVLLTTPLLLLAVLLPLGVLVDSAFVPGFHWPLFAIGLVAGSFEEIGWTGFATPRLLARQRLPMAGLGLGLVWALWHLLVDFRYNIGTMGSAWLLQFAIFVIATLTSYRLLMTWVYANTKSLLLAVLMHASYTGWLFVLFPAAASVRQNLAWQAAFAAVLWLIAAVALRGPNARTNAATT